MLREIKTIKIKKVNVFCDNCDNKQPLKKGKYVHRIGDKTTYDHYCGKCKQTYELEHKYPVYMDGKNRIFIIKE